MHEWFIEAHPEVKAWLKGRPKNTQRIFARRLKKFCEAVDVEPEQWRRMDKFEARDLAWTFIQPLTFEHSSTAKSTMTALKSWFRNLNGELLPFDSGRGGKHHFRVVYKKRATEKVPKKTEMYQIIDMASSLRDKAILLFLFQSGVRVNVLQHILYGDVADELENDVIALKITGRLDHKLRGRNIPFYYTFLNGEAAETLKRYCEVKHKKREAEKPLFYTSSNKPVTAIWVWRIVKMCVKRAGFDPKTISTHTVRKAFRKIVRQANIDDDDKEQLTGHTIPGSREAYFDEKDIGLIKEAYLACNFTREVPESNHVRMKTRIDYLENQNVGLTQMVQDLKDELAAMKNDLKALKK